MLEERPINSGRYLALRQVSGLPVAGSPRMKQRILSNRSSLARSQVTKVVLCADSEVSGKNYEAWV